MSAQPLATYDPQAFVDTLAYVSPSLGDWAQRLLKDSNHSVAELSDKLEAAFHLALEARRQAEAA